MKFDTQRIQTEMLIHSTEIGVAHDRWAVAASRHVQEVIGRPMEWFDGVMTKSNRIQLSLGLDKHCGDRRVIIKTVNYHPEILNSENGILESRQILKNQIDLLNVIASPLLPEPLDWFTTHNDYDNPFSEKLRSSEPVLVLDYQPGQALRYFAWKGFFRPADKESPRIQFFRIARFGRRIVAFIRILKEKDYCYLDLNLDHILMLRDDIPRFIGLGHICKVNSDGRLNFDDINFGQTSRGYAAPELNDPTNDWKSAKEAFADKIESFSLGVVLYQMFSGVDQSQIDTFDNALLQKGSFIFNDEAQRRIDQNEVLLGKNPNRIKAIKYLIQRLCRHNPSDRLSDFDEIDGLLANIAGDADSEAAEEEREYRRTHPEVKCSDCGHGFRLPLDRLNDLKTKGKPIRCRKCKETAHREYVASTLEVTCNNCDTKFRIKNEILNYLKSKNRPIQCSSCYEANNLEVRCQKCGKMTIRPKQILNDLKAKGRSIQCRDCYKPNKFSQKTFHKHRTNKDTFFLRLAQTILGKK